MPDAAELLARFDDQLRGQVPRAVPAGMRVEHDGPLVRLTGWAGGGFVEGRELDQLDGARLDALIARQVSFFATRGEPFEWKLYGHDRPDLPERLVAAGFAPDEVETVVIAPVAVVAADPRLPDGVSIREVGERRDLERIDELEQAVWQGGPRLAADLEAELVADPGGLAILVAEAGATVVSAGWIRFAHGTDFATLWGGSTLPAWRRRGIYRALVARRAALAAERGFRYVQVDASADSRPILERLGFVAVATTTPFRWTPPDAR